MDEKDQIAVLLEYRSEDLRKALRISEGQLAALTAETDRRERVMKIFKLWEEKTEVITVEVFVKNLNRMWPLPLDVVELCLNNSSNNDETI